MTLYLGMIDNHFYNVSTTSLSNEALSSRSLDIGILGGALALTVTVILVLIYLLVRKKNSKDVTDSPMYTVERHT